MKEVWTLGTRLMLFALVAALLLALTYQVTEGPIEAQKQGTAVLNRAEVLPGDKDFELIYESSEEIESIYQSSLGYVFSVRTQGYGSGGVLVTIGLGKDGKIVGVRVDASGETAGLGSKVGEEAFYGQFVGRTLDNATGVDAISGATVSSTAVKRAVRLTVEYARANLGM